MLVSQDRLLRLPPDERLPCSTPHTLVSCRSRTRAGIRSRGNLRRELAELVAHHVFGNGHVMVGLSVVDLELEPHEVGQDGGRPRLCLDRDNPLAWHGADDGKTIGWLLGVRCVGARARGKFLRDDVRACEDDVSGLSRADWGIGRGFEEGYLSTRISPSIGTSSAASWWCGDRDAGNSRCGRKCAPAVFRDGQTNLELEKKSGASQCRSRVVTARFSCTWPTGIAQMDDRLNGVYGRIDERIASPVNASILDWEWAKPWIFA